LENLKKTGVGWRKTKPTPALLEFLF